MRVCKECKFFDPFKDGAAMGTCRHPHGGGVMRHYLDNGCTFFRSAKWKGCLVSFPTAIAIVFFYLFDLLVYFVFGKTLYKRTQGKEKP